MTRILHANLGTVQIIKEGGTEIDISQYLPNPSFLISAFIHRAWPVETWDDGAVVSISGLTSTSIHLTTNHSQQYAVVVNLVYRMIE